MIPQADRLHKRPALSRCLANVFARAMTIFTSSVCVLAAMLSVCPQRMAAQAAVSVNLSNVVNATTAPLSGNGLAAPTAAAIDAAGNAWFANSTGAVLSAFTPSGTALAGSPFTSSGISQPVFVAFDAIGNLWVANAGNDSILELTSSGVPAQQISTTAASSSIAINPK